jgi:hypothetical protein
MSDEQRAELLRVQASSIHSPIDLTQVKMLSSGACQFELTDKPGKTFQEFEGMILHAHPSNVLWDKPYGTAPDPNNKLSSLPACSSNDDEYGIPREGFAHEGLPAGQVGDGILKVACGTCPYNQWGTGHKLVASPNKSPRGKAVTNQRRIYIRLPDRLAPVVLVAPPTSVPAFDEWANGLLDQLIPYQTKIVKFSQHRAGPAHNPYAVLDFSIVRDAEPEEFQAAMAQRERYRTTLFPPAPVTAQVVEAEPGEAAEDDDIPW